MAVHYLSQGNLVTHEGETWQFALAPALDELPESIRVLWEYGAHSRDRTDASPMRPIARRGAGSGPTSEPIPFAVAAPYTVRALILLDREMVEFTATEEFVEQDEDGNFFIIREIIVYPGVVTIEVVPRILAQTTRGYLPILIQFFGLGKNVRIHGDVVYDIAIRLASRVASFDVETDRFVRALGRNVDQPATSRENGRDSTYIVYLDPEIISSFPLAGETAAVRDSAAVFVEIEAYPVPEGSEKAEYFDAGPAKFEYYVDRRPYLLHMQERGSPASYSMSGDGSRVGRAEGFLRRLKGTETVDFPVQAAVPPIPGTQVLQFYASRPMSLTSAGEVVIYRDESDLSGNDVKLTTELRDRSGILFDDWVDCRVEGARRGAAAVVYYKLTNQPYTSVLGNRMRCLVGPATTKTGQLTAGIFDGETADVEISGLDDSGVLFEYADLAAPALAGGSVLLNIGGLVGSPWIAVPLAVATLVAGIWWTNTPAGPDYPYTDCRAQVLSLCTLHNADGQPKTVEGDIVKARPVSVSKPGEPLDVSFGVNDTVVPGDLIRLSQVYAVYNLQRQDESLHTVCNLSKSGFERAVKLAVYA